MFDHIKFQVFWRRPRFQVNDPNIERASSGVWYIKMTTRIKNENRNDDLKSWTSLKNLERRLAYSCFLVFLVFSTFVFLFTSQNEFKN